MTTYASTKAASVSANMISSISPFIMVSLG